jgi:sporulation protein YlmC with PRC-barrel domain
MRYVLSLAALLLTSQLVAQQATPTNPDQPTDPSIRTGTPGVPTTPDATRPGTFRDSAARDQKKVFRASKIIGASVKNKANEDLGSVQDLMIDPADGRVTYATISMGGVLGVGAKLYAVPWDTFECREMNGKHVAFLEIDKNTLESAQVFDEQHWPDMTNAQWRAENDRPFQSLRQRRHEVYRPIQQPGARQPGAQQPGTQPQPGQPAQQQ